MVRIPLMRWRRAVGVGSMLEATALAICPTCKKCTTSRPRADWGASGGLLELLLLLSLLSPPVGLRGCFSGEVLGNSGLPFGLLLLFVV